jgi:hypothetical protein
LSEIFLILRGIQRDIIIKVHTSSCKVAVIFCQILKKLEFSRQIFKKYSNTNFPENPSSGSRVPWGRTDRKTDVTKLIVAFHNFAKLPKTAKTYSVLAKNLNGTLSAEFCCYLKLMTRMISNEERLDGNNYLLVVWTH